MNNSLLLIPVLSALTGWLTIRIAIYFLFHPRSPKKIAGLSIQGILPGKQKELAEKIGSVVTKELFSSVNLEEKISNPENLAKILPMIDAHIDDFLKNKLAKEMPVIGMFVGDKTIGKVKETFMKEIETLFPEIMKAYAANMKQDNSLHQKIVEKIAAFPVETAEKNFHELAGRELRLAAWAGAAIGFTLGILEVGLLLLAA